MEEHIQHIEMVLEKLQDANFYVKLGKCQFGVEEIKFLGHIVGKDGMRPDPEKVKAVKEMSIPKDEKAVSRFLGMAGFYRKYVKNFSARTSNLRELMKKDKKFEWTKECEKEFNDIKNALCKRPVMAYPDWKKKFILSTDASIQGLGATLSQMGPAGEQVIAYASRSLNDHEKKYGVTKMEALGVVWATDLFKIYLQDRPFDLITDHRALVKFKELKDTNPTLERWSIKLSAYDFNIMYREGKKHVNADCLSRDPVNVIEERKNEMREAQQKDEILRNIFDRCMKEGKITLSRETEDIQEIQLESFNDAFIIKGDGRLYLRSLRKGDDKKDRLCIPVSERAKVLSQVHDHHHCETKKTYKELKEKVWWNGMYGDCDLYCKSCELCARRNSPTGKQKGIIKMMDVKRKFELIGIDLMTPGPKSIRGYEHVLVVTDYATKWSEAIPVRDKRSQTIADALWDHWVCKFGFPERIISDNGGEFTADEMAKALIEVSKIRQHLITPYNPRANGQVERFNKTLANRLAKYTGDYQNTWDKYIATVCYDYNCTRHSSTGETPYFLVFGQEPKTGLDKLIGDIRKEVENEIYDVKRWIEEDIPSMMSRMRYAQENRKKSQMSNMEMKNKDKENIEYILGDKVWVREEPRTKVDLEIHKKLRLPWVGPFEISKADKELYGNSYQVKRIEGDKEEVRVVNVMNLKRYYERPEWMKTNDVIIPEIIPEERREVEPVMEDPRDRSFQPPKEKESGTERKNTVTQLRTPRNLWIKKPGDLVDMKFNRKEKQGYKMYWACGTIEKINEEDKDELYIKFLDGEEGWYNIRDDKEGPLEVRQCQEKDGHKRSDNLSILVIDKKCQNRKQRKERKRSEREKLGEMQTKVVKEKVEMLTSIKETEIPGDLLAEVSNRSQSLVTSFATSNIAIELQFRNKPITIRCNIGEMKGVLERLT